MILLKANNLGEAIVQGAISFLILSGIVYLLIRLLSKKDNSDNEKSSQTNLFTRQIQKIKSTIPLGYLRILFILSIIIPVILTYNTQLDDYSIIAFVLLTALNFFIYWLIVRLIIWVYDGFSAHKKN